LKLKLLTSIILLIAIAFTFTVYKNKKDSYSSLSTPDRINIYADGRQKQIIRSDKNDQVLFNIIYNSVEVKSKGGLSGMLGFYTGNDIKEIKGYGIEFVYNKPQTITVKSGKQQIQFTEVNFPLSERWKNSVFFKGVDNFYHPMGPITLDNNLDALIKSSVE
jgi:hypothetical protein